MKRTFVLGVFAVAIGVSGCKKWGMVLLGKEERSKTTTEDPDPFTMPTTTATSIPTIAKTTEPARVIPSGWLVRTGPVYSVATPSDWTSVGGLSNGVDFAWRSPTSIGGFLPNVNVASEPFSGDGPAYGRANKTALVSAGKGISIRVEKELRFAGKDGYYIEASWPKSAGGHRTAQWYTIYGGSGYVFTCSGADASYELSRGMCEQMAASFRFR